MFCPHCGAENTDNAWRCISCGAVLQSEAGTTVPAPVQVPNLLVPSILITIFCCWPLGIPSIIYAAQVNSKAAAGDLEGAMQAAKTSKMWMGICAGVGVLVGIGYFVLAVAMGLSGHSSSF